MPDYFVHRQAICDSTDVGQGTRIWAFSHVMEGAHLGKGCNIGEHVFIEGEVSLGDGCTVKNGVAIWDRVTAENSVFIGPYAVFTNDLKPRAFLKRGSAFYKPTLLKEGCTIGANATIVCGHTIGEFSMVGAGCVVTDNVPAFTLVAGNPMRVLGQICYCGERLEAEKSCAFCGVPLKDNSVEHAQKVLEEKKAAL